MSLLLPPFELHEPRTVEEAVRLKAELPEADFVAGREDRLANLLERHERAKRRLFSDLEIEYWPMGSRSLRPLPAGS